MALHPKIQERKRAAAPITYSTNTIETRDAEFLTLLDQRIVRGYGCIWGTKNLHGERFHKGVFERSIRENGPGSGAAFEIKFRDEHGRAMSLFEELREDSVGLYFKTKPLDAVAWADDFLTQLRSSTINNFSNGFRYIFERNAMIWNDAEETLEMYEARLLEISGVAIPSDMETYAVRNAEENELLYEETEAFIHKVPRKDQLELRKLIARHKSQNDALALDQQMKDLKKRHTPVEKGIDFEYLLQKLQTK